jgi:hypothetical protein
MTSQAELRRSLRRRLEADLDASTKELQAVRGERDRYLNLLQLLKGDLEHLAPELFTEKPTPGGRG